MCLVVMFTINKRPTRNLIELSYALAAQTHFAIVLELGKIFDIATAYTQNLINDTLHNGRIVTFNSL